MNEVTSTKPMPTNVGSSEGSTSALLERIDRKLARLESAVERIEALEKKLPGALATFVDSFDDVAAGLQERGVDFHERLRVLLEVAERLTSPEALKAVTTVLDKLPLIQHMLESGILAEPSVDVVGRAGYALSAARAEKTRGVGLFGAARAMSDDDVKRAVGFLLRVAQLFGRSLDEPARPLLSEGERV